MTLFGRFRAFAGDADIRPRGRKAAAILAFVASQDRRSAPRTKLADLLWSDRAPEQARASLRQSIAELRSAVPEALVISREDVSLHAGAVTSDAEQIAMAAARGDMVALARSLDDIDGSFLDDMDGLSPGFDEWLQVERVRQQEWLIATVLAGLSDAPATDDLRERQRILGALQALDPLNETVVRKRLQLDHATGDAASMHRRFRRFADLLLKELGVRPSPETCNLFEELISTVPEPRTDRLADPTTSATLPPLVLVNQLVSDDAPGSAEIAAACSEDIRIALAQHRELRVLMPGMIEPGLLRTMSTTAIAAYILSGSVRRSGGEARINLQLGNVASGVVSWSEQLRLGETPTADVVEHVVSRAVGAVMPTIDRELPTMPLPKSGTSGAWDAVLLYARGRKLARDARTLEEARAGATLLEETIAADSRHVGARLLLAQLYNSDFWHMLAGHDARNFRARALKLAEEAAAIDPGNLRVRLRLGWCYLRRRDWGLAEHAFREAADGLPYDADALNECAFGLCQLGEVEDALRLMQRVFRLNPFAPADYHADQAVMLAFAGQAEASEEHFEVSPEKGLIYQAVRLGNLLALGRASPREVPLQRQFLRDFASIWQRQAPFDRDDITEWLDLGMCLRHGEHRELVKRGVDAAWSARGKEQSVEVC